MSERLTQQLSPPQAFAQGKQEASKHGGPKGALDAAFADPVMIGNVRLPGSLSIGALLVLTEAESVFITGADRKPETIETIEAIYCCAEPKAARRALQAASGKAALRAAAIEWACDIPAPCMGQLADWLNTGLAQIAEANPSLPPEELAPAPEAMTPPPDGQ